MRRILLVLLAITALLLLTDASPKQRRRAMTTGSYENANKIFSSSPVPTLADIRGRRERQEDGSFSRAAPLELKNTLDTIVEARENSEASIRTPQGNDSEPELASTIDYPESQLSHHDFNGETSDVASKFGKLSLGSIPKGPVFELRRGMSKKEKSRAIDTAARQQIDGDGAVVIQVNPLALWGDTDTDPGNNSSRESSIADMSEVSFQNLAHTIDEHDSELSVAPAPINLGKWPRYRSMGNLHTGSVSEERPWGDLFDSRDSQKTYFLYRSADCHARVDTLSNEGDEELDAMLEDEGGVIVWIAHYNSLFYILSEKLISVCQPPLYHQPLSFYKAKGYAVQSMGVLFPSFMPKKRSPPGSSLEIQDRASSSPNLPAISPSRFRAWLNRIIPGRGKKKAHTSS